MNRDGKQKWGGEGRKNQRTEKKQCSKNRGIDQSNRVRGRGKKTALSAENKTEVKGHGRSKAESWRRAMIVEGPGSKKGEKRWIKGSCRRWDGKGIKNRS